jgi:hypothetical protein
MFKINLFKIKPTNVMKRNNIVQSLRYGKYTISSKITGHKQDMYFDYNKHHMIKPIQNSFLPGFILGYVCGKDPRAFGGIAVVSLCILSVCGLTYLIFSIFDNKYSNIAQFDDHSNTEIKQSITKST